MLNIYIKDSLQSSLSLKNAYHLECYHLIFVFVKTKTCMSPSTTPLFFYLVHIFPVPFFLLSEISCYLIKYTALYSQKCMLSRYIFNVQWDYTADLYLKPTKYSKILNQKLPSRVIFEIYAYTRIEFM